MKNADFAVHELSGEILDAESKNCLSDAGGVEFEPHAKWRYHPHNPFFLFMLLFFPKFCSVIVGFALVAILLLRERP
jgi:hypothetical protein